MGSNNRDTPAFAWGPGRQNQSAWVRLDGFTGEYRLSSGQGNERGSNGGKTETTVYQVPGAYVVQAHELGSAGAFLASVQVVVRRERILNVEVSPLGDGSGGQVTFGDVDETGILSQYHITWGDEGEDNVWGVPFSQATRALPEGEHRVAVEDLTTRNRTTRTITVAPPATDPDWTLTPDESDPARRTAVVTITEAAPDRTVMVDWGDQRPGDTVGESGVVSRTLNPEDSYEQGGFFVSATYADATSEEYAARKRVHVHIPFPPGVL